MPHIHLCFVWHMHQPFYKDLIAGEYRLPWTRMHALKDYYGMVQVLNNFPTVHQTFNLVPSLLAQIEEYASGMASDPFLAAALKPAEDLSQREQEFILQYFFQATTRVIGRFPRYQELFEQWQSAGRNPARARRMFGVHSMRDLQVLSQLAWFDEEFLAHDAEVRELVRKGRNFSPADQALIGRKETEIAARIIPACRDFAVRGQVELSTTPFFHPILPLICDSNIANISHPYVPLPPRFCWPDDARWHLQTARGYMKERLGVSVAGLWPSEGSVSDEVLGLAAGAGFRWAATDNGVLARSIGQDAGPERSYQPWLWSKGGRQMHMIFRDHYLSDLIGFVYSKVGAHEAAADFIGRIRSNAGPLIDSGRDALVPIILDGENAWEYYEQNGRPFLRELYRLISEAGDLTALTVSEALERVAAAPMNHIFPGSWINANFDVWIGAEEDNKAWELLLEARQTYEQTAPGVTEEKRKLAWQELMIAEGSDWCWWYGPEHYSANRAEFDQLYRDHLTNVYRLLGEPVPPEFAEPIICGSPSSPHDPPSGYIQPAIDGKLTTPYEWQDAGRYSLTSRSAAMHCRRPLVQALYYGTDAKNLFFRLDLLERATRTAPLRFEFRIRNAEGTTFYLTVAPDSPPALTGHPDLPDGAVLAAVDEICEVQISMSLLRVRPGDPIFFLLTVYRNGLPATLLPPIGELALRCSPMIAAAF